ncbi:TIGR03086 family metal-binding protein [Streptomyces sp. B-S-A8]|uniref:TIGR03086 family metal-binding protein n=1 Tax=Streptomyces solicavernae TaxID=3043614 RepID=A0ABT6RSL0_9ACTN|nr:TIGR03086 family metal-binding protein [Streptomyces sp. B-S-A8]MDI3387418.1 TIGR03086 family metal-binding protein [Streptomyces sp. B-S-A8]
MADTSTSDGIVDLTPQARIVARLAERVDDTGLSDVTPCRDYAVRNLLGHLTHLAGAFRDAARKDFGPTTDTDPGSSLPDIGPDWRAELPKVLDELAGAWREPSAWEGETRAGGVVLPAAVMAQVAIDELVIHGWDLARATGQDYAPDPACLAAAYGLLDQSREPESRGTIFGPVVEVPQDAPLLDRAVGLAGRDPSWSVR